MSIKIVNSFGVVVKEDTIGAYQTEAPVVIPTEEVKEDESATEVEGE